MSLSPEIIFKSFQDAIQHKPQLEKLEVFGVSCILHKAIEKLLIIKELLQGPEKADPSKLGYMSPAIRMKERSIFVPPEALLPENVLLSQKLKWEISFIIDLFEETLIEFEFNGSQVYLEYTLCCDNLTLLDNQTIKTENKDYNVLIASLEEKLKNYKQNNHRTQQYLLESTGPCLDKAVVNVYAEENLGSLFGRVREVTRIEKNVLKCKENERTVKELTEKLSCEVEEENLIHAEINSHLALLITELTNKVEYWTNKYNNEIDQLDIDLLQMKSQQDEQTTALEALKRQFTEKEEIMEALQVEYDARERETRKKLLENKAAEKIQRWWKNILFKRKLLKYRKNPSKNKVKKQSVKKRSKK